VCLSYLTLVCSVIMAVVRVTITLTSIGVIEGGLDMGNRFGDVLSLPGMANCASLAVNIEESLTPGAGLHIM